MKVLQPWTLVKTKLKKEDLGVSRPDRCSRSIPCKTFAVRAGWVARASSDHLPATQRPAVAHLRRCYRQYHLRHVFGRKRCVCVRLGAALIKAQRHGRPHQSTGHETLLQKGETSRPLQAEQKPRGLNNWQWGFARFLGCCTKRTGNASPGTALHCRQPAKRG